MKIEVHPAGERGQSELGWLHSRFSFSFAEYYDPDKMGFGALRVLNDDAIEPGRGFGMHPHDNMETVTFHQNASFLMGHLDPGTEVMHQSADPKMGQYLFVIRGKILAGGKTLDERDAAAITEAGLISISAEKASQILLIEVPMGQRA